MSNDDSAAKGVETISDAEMIEVSKEFFFEGMVLPIKIYLKIHPQSYLLIGKKDDKANFSNLHVYNNSKVGVYVWKADQPILISYVTQLTSKIVTQKSVPDVIKLKFITNLTTDAMDSLEKSGFTSIAKIQKVSQIAQQLSKNLTVFDELLVILSDLEPVESKHAMTTCLISLLLADEMHMNQVVVQEKLALGALLHDVGMRYVPKSILEKPRHTWTPEELLTYEQHPLKSIEMLRDLKDISQDVLLIVVEHHENALGTGFPKRLRDVKISPLGRIVLLANHFANLLFGSLAQSKCYTPDEAIQYIEEVQGQPFNKQVFSGLKNIINKKNLLDKS